MVRSRVLRSTGFSQVDYFDPGHAQHEDGVQLGAFNIRGEMLGAEFPDGDVSHLAEAGSVVHRPGLDAVNNRHTGRDKTMVLVVV